jgi:hypothetical protein
MIVQQSVHAAQVRPATFGVWAGAEDIGLPYRSVRAASISLCRAAEHETASYAMALRLYILAPAILSGWRTPCSC